jgi:hypothetical protein
MRFLLFGMIGGLLVGCSSSSQPEAGRGETERRFERPPAASLPEGHPSPQLPPGHPPIGPAVAGADEPLDDAGGEVKLDAITLTAPEGWGRKPPQSTFLLAEFVLPKAEGDDADGRLTVSTAGGSIEANVDRWKGQFKDLADSQEEKLEVDGVEVTVVDLSGEFQDQRGPFAPATSHPDYRMIAAIIPVEAQMHFIKATGPQATMKAHEEKIHEFVRSTKRNK